MPYFNQEMKKEVVSRLKKNFEGWKFSIKVLNHAEISVKVKSAPLDLWSNYVETVGVDNLYGDDGFAKLNHYYLERAFSGECLEQMKKILDDMNLVGDEKFGNYNRSNSQVDHFDIGYYVSLAIGTFDKSFEYIPQISKRSEFKK